MEKEKVQDSTQKKANYIFIALYIIAIVLLFLMFRPYFSYLVLGAIISLFLFPLNIRLRKLVKNKIASSLIMTCLVLLFIIVPTAYLGYTITIEATNAYNVMLNTDYTLLSEQLSSLVSFDINLEDFIAPFGNLLVNYASGALPELLNTIADLSIKLFLMFFLIYYAFKEGDVLLAGFMNILPISKSHKDQLQDEANKVLFGVLHGQFLIALLQGFLGGLGFWVFGFPNPVFWGFVMAILAFIPVLGTPLVWIPASLIALSQGNKFGAIGMLLFGGIIVMNIDNFLKPKLIGKKTGMHPMLVLLGIFGGIHLFGIIGMIIGPVIVAICMLIIKFFNHDVIFT